MSLLLASTSHYIGMGIDIAVVLILLTFACIGYHHGLLKSVLALCTTAVVLFVAIYFANDFAKLINSAYDFTSLIAKKLAPSIAKMNSIYTTTFPAGMSGSQFYSSYIATSNTNSIIKRFFKFALKGFSADKLEGLNVAEVLAGSLASIILTVVAGIVLFIVVKIALHLLSRLFENITRTKVLGGLNKILGFAFGAIKGGVVVAFFIVITICISFVPKINKKIYPLVQEDTKIVKIAYNTSDKLVEKYFIKSNVINKWINNLWDGRHLDKDEPVDTIADKSTLLPNADFALDSSTYTATFSDKTIKSSGTYFRLNKIDSISTNPTVNITIELTYTNPDTISLDLYSISDLETKITKDGTSTTISFVYASVNYTDFIIELISSGADITTEMNISIN